MSPFVVAIAAIVILVILLFLRMPLGIAFGAVGFFGTWVVAGWPAARNAIATIPYNTMTTYTWTVMPLFMLMGYLTLYSGIADEFFEGVQKWLGHFRGGLATSVIVGNTGFGACTGDQMAATVTFTAVSLPILRRYRYDDKLTLGTCCAGGILAGLIPPSTPLIVFGALTEVSIGKLFMAGVLPGLLLSALYIIAIYFWCLANPAAGPAGPKATWKERWGATPGMWAIVVIFAIILGGLFKGVFTPTEAGGCAAFAVLIIGLARRKLNFQRIMKALLDTGVIFGMLALLLVGTMLFNRFLILSGFNVVLSRLVAEITHSPTGMLWVVVVLYMFLGMFIPPIAIILVTMPLLYPPIIATGVNPIHLGIVATLVNMCGNLTPPVGATVFAVGGMVRDVDVYTIFRGVIPFLVAALVCTAFLIYFPQISLVLPNMMMR